MNDGRRSPEEILKSLQNQSKVAHRGHLRVFLGMCPGVGKTYAMLKAAREQQNRDIRVLVGVVESHGRKETEDLLLDLEVLPKKKIQYKNSELLEMDLDRILNEKPDLVLVDELAHSNVPGSRHEKRYQDIEEILNAGINVYTTVNIQHIESRNDQIAQITEVKVRETVPDIVLEEADQVEVVDLAPSELLRRLKEGKVYLGERAEYAAQNFFREEKLTALRELALRFTAERVDKDLQDHMTIQGIEGPWNINERLLVAISHSPYSARLIRATKRMAGNLEAPWVALYVDTGERLNPEDQETLQKNLSLARDLGAEVVAMAGTNLVYAIQMVCRDKNVTQIVMGRPDRRFFQDIFTRGTLLDQLVRTTSKIDVHVIRAERTPRYRGLYLRWPELKTGLLAYYNATWFLMAVSFFCYVLLPFVGYRALGSVFLLSILVVATLSTRGPILYAASVCAVVWNYFFIPPTFTFAISASEDVMMVLSFFVTALVGGLLTSRIRRQEEILQTREELTRHLYELGKNLSDAKDENGIVHHINSTIDKVFAGRSVVVLVGKDKKIDLPSHTKMNEKDFAVAMWTFEHGKPAGWSTQTLSASPCLCYPMKGNSGTVGVIALYPKAKDKVISPEQETFLDSAINQASVAVERLRFSETAQNAKLLEASEKLHQTLLNSVSHELRTPITTIIGASTALKDPKTFNDEKARFALTDELVRSAERLDRVVENLLDISRLEKGTLQLKKEWFEARDLIDEVKSSVANELDGRKINAAGELGLLLEGDFKLLHHALSNIVLNSIRYAKPHSDIEIEVESKPNVGFISVKDDGPGIPAGAETRIFEKFYRLPGTPAGGLGLGLSIVKNIFESHGGRVWAANRADGGGAVFKCEIPVKQAPLKLKEVIK